MPKQRMFDITDTWTTCPECGKKACRERRKACADPRLQGVTFIEIRCLACGHTARRREVQPA